MNVHRIEVQDPSIESTLSERSNRPDNSTKVVFVVCEVVYILHFVRKTSITYFNFFLEL